jgi:branched-chain amino acid transport system permease protein
VSGPVIGAIAFVGLQEELARATDLWRLFLGLVIIALVLAFPQGLAGFIAARFAKTDADPATEAVP